MHCSRLSRIIPITNMIFIDPNYTGIRVPKTRIQERHSAGLDCQEDNEMAKGSTRSHKIDLLIIKISVIYTAHKGVGWFY